MPMKPQHGGNAGKVAKRLGLTEAPVVRFDFSVNLNPIGPPPALRGILLRGADTAVHYPNEYAEPACRALAAVHGFDPEHVIVGNGSTEVFGWILQALRPASAATVAPAYGGYAEVSAAAGLPMAEAVTLSSDTGFRLSVPFEVAGAAEIIFVGSPNNPTGGLVSPDALRELTAKRPGATVVLDVSFIDFAGPPCPDELKPENLPANVIVVKSLTKFFSIAGLRLGMAWGGQELIELVKTVRLPWSVNGLSQALAPALYTDEDYMARSRARTQSLRERFVGLLQELPGFSVSPADANFVLVHLPQDWPGARLQGELLRRGILIRSCEDFTGLDPNCCRLAVRPENEQDALLEALRQLYVPGTAPVPASPRKTPAVMVVGTTSNAGKSIVAAGLCRLLARRGLDVAPFKAQNMALNSYVTAEGGEMGRAQVTQAYAAGLEPHTDMNPVLLKPLGENGSQVIVNGKPVGNFRARDYYERKQEMREAAHAAYDRLAARHDFIVLEGAGSPAEINLMEEDFVNMHMAAYAGARTVLVADIDRGGVFASILGTISLLPPDRRRLFAGVIINKFRGDVSLLESGIRDVEAMTGVPVLGVLPYIADIRIEDEDSLGLERIRETPDAALDIAVLRLPRISNFTDYLAMALDTGVQVRYVGGADSLGTPDLIVIPGTKNTRGDLQWLHDSGFGAALKRLHGEGIPLIGVCGGFQILGESVVDEDGVEGDSGETPGLGLLPVTTRLGPRKELAQVEGVATSTMPFCEPGTEFRGYEIHAGETRLPDASRAPLTITRRGGASVEEPAGAVSEDGRVFGCYIHGLFDGAALRCALWRRLCDRKGVPHDKVVPVERTLSAEFDRLADLMEEHLELDVLTRP